MSRPPHKSTEAAPPPPPASAGADAEEFRRAAGLHRKELLLHCYRMVGSLHDAEDLVQETLLRAWRGLGRYQGRASLRNWLYRIATNVCLDALSRRSRMRRVFPEDVGAPTSRMPIGLPSREIAWIEPYPDSALEGLVDAAPDPSAQYDLRETVRLAFIGATQRLPARQRAVLLLRDVLGWSAAETGKALNMTTASVTSALQRARGTLEKGLSREEVGDASSRSGDDDSIANRYARAWERKDLDGLVALLAKEATLSMPPWPQWYSGRAQLRTMIKWGWRNLSGGGTYRMVATRANAQPAFGMYLRLSGEARFKAHLIHALDLRDGQVVRITLFVNPDLFPRFQLPLELSG